MFGSLLAGLAILALLAQGAVASGWGTPGPIETDNAGNVGSPQVAVDGSGNGVAVWYQSDGTRYNIWANRYVAGTGWGTAGLIETENLGDAGAPQVAVDGSGDAVAVWYQWNGGRFNIWANRYVAGTGWGTARLIETDLGDAFAPHVAVDPSGNAVAVWVQSDGMRYNIWANRYVAGTGWATAGLIGNDAGDAASPQVAVDGSGNAVAVWYQFDGTRNNIWANRYVAGTGWGTAGLIETDNAANAGDPQVALDGSGNAVAVWVQSDGTRYNVWANRYVAGTGWGTAGLIETDNAGNAAYPQVALDGSGNALAVWYQWDGTRDNIWANRYVAGIGWGTAGLIETDNAGDGRAPQVAVDLSGNAVAVWFQFDGARFNIWANQYVAGTGWGTAGLIETENAGPAGDPQVAVDLSGNALAVWYQNEGAGTNIWANRLVEGHPPALVLASPAPGFASNMSTVWVAGATEPGAALSANGVAVSVASDGSFGFLLALAPGVNEIRAAARDAAGNVATAALDVTFQDPVPSLQAQLGAAQANLTAEQARVTALETDALATENDLAAARADVTAAQAKVSSLAADLIAARAALNSTKSSLDSTAANLSRAEGRVTALETHSNAADAGSGQVGLALAVGLAGLALGALGLVMGLRNRVRPAVKEMPRPPEEAVKDPPPK